MQIECEFQFISAENTFGLKSQFIQNAQHKTFKAQREHKLFAIKLQEIYGKAAVAKKKRKKRKTKSRGKNQQGKLAILMQLSHRQFTRKNNNNLQQ